MLKKLLPVIFSIILFAAHLSRNGYDILAIITLLVPLILLIKKQWVPQFFSFFLFIAGVEWVHRGVTLTKERIAEGRPYTAALIILLSVALVTFASIIPLRSKKVKDYYG